MQSSFKLGHELHDGSRGKYGARGNVEYGGGEARDDQASKRGCKEASKPQVTKHEATEQEETLNM